ncbi:MAG TPA: hypothetical protein VFT65_11290 [Candidatus Angelobacter sp.]|nr:hypothetical protein [Candidatus Angelobacter sp.]
MFDGRFRLGMMLLLMPGLCSAGQQRNREPQSPRQAILEMFSGGEAAMRKHLTIPMQRKLQELTKDAPLGTGPLETFVSARAAAGDNFQGFDLGPILFALNNPQMHERYEVQLDTEEPRGDDDAIGLSVHLIRNGIEQEMPAALRFTFNMKRQEGTWRLNTITMNATLFAGDPRVLDKSWLGPALLMATGTVGETPAVVDDRPKMSPVRAVRLIGIAEHIYAQAHPGIGFTCRMSDLVNVGKGLDEEGVYRFMDAEFAQGVYNGYRFTLAGCERKPANDFHIVAEPLMGKGSAYCSDHANNLRTSDDGRGATCLTSGKIARR